MSWATCATTRRCVCAHTFSPRPHHTFTTHLHPAPCHTQAWASATEPYGLSYRYGCEPYLLYNRLGAPSYSEVFVGYGKDRVSFTYEMAARGFVFVMQPDAWLVHYTTPVDPRPGRASAAASRPGRKAAAYGHDPAAWQIGESCWPEFEARVHAEYGYRNGWCDYHSGTPPCRSSL